ncbi:DMT family transporter [Aliibacillus thermotolerans]|uniref:DMT family transporter n=1 Tax=Aliibacillus thermotolerans TaxID=1834418 RepID=A0ABW0U7R0_9BACI|nr:DMT family transporter [Aliibacillus thermotolerans]MDA3130130.1 EamA family transporter [Aliibacillus thermotolerans]
MNRNQLLFNYFLVFVVMMIWGLNVVLLKVLVEHMPPATMQALRIFTAGVVLILLIAVKREWTRFQKQEMKNMLLASIFGVVGHHFFLAFGLMHTTAVNASLILALVPLATSLFAMILLGDRITKWRLFGIFLGLIGVFFITATGEEVEWGRLSLGDTFIFLAVITQAISFIYIRKGTKTISTRVFTGYMFIIGSVILFLISLIMEPGRVNEVFQVPWEVWSVFLLSAVFATAIGHQVFNRSIQIIGAGETAVFNNIVPFFGLVSAAIFLKESIYPFQWLGFLIVVIGVLFGTGYVEEKMLQNRQMKQKRTHS